MSLGVAEDEQNWSTVRFISHMGPPVTSAASKARSQPVKHSQPSGWAGGRSVRQRASSSTLVSTPPFFQLQQGQQQGQQQPQTLGLQPVQPQQPLVSKREAGGGRSTGWALSLLSRAAGQAAGTCTSPAPGSFQHRPWAGGSCTALLSPCSIAVWLRFGGAPPGPRCAAAPCTSVLHAAVRSEPLPQLGQL